MEKTFAVIVNKKVINIIVGVDDEVVASDPTTYIEYTDANSAGIGYEYNITEGIFIPPKPYPSWKRLAAAWKAPIPKPTDGKFYNWSENDLAWIVQ